MSGRAKTLLTKYGCCAAFVALLAYVYISARDFAGAELWEQLVMICDALTIPGSLLILAGAMIWVSNMGALDGLSYAVTWTIKSLIPGARVGMDETYADYVERKREKPIRGYGFLFIAGGITMAVAIVFLIAYRFFD